MILDAEPAKKREANAILGATSKKEFFEKEKEVTELPQTISINAAAPADSSATPKAKAKAKAITAPEQSPEKRGRGRPRNEVTSEASIPVNKEDKYTKQKGQRYNIKQLIAALERANKAGDVPQSDKDLVVSKIKEYEDKPSKPAIKAIIQSLLTVYNRLTT